MIQDILFSDIRKGYSEVIQDEYDLTITGDTAYNWSELDQLNFPFEINPRIDNYSMGKGAGIIAVSRASIGFGSSKAEIQLFDANSIKIGSFFTDSKCKYAYPHVLDNDDVMVVTDTGDICKYSATKLVSKECIGNKIGSQIIKTAFYDGGVVLALASGFIVDVENYDTPKIMQTIPNLSMPSAMIAIPPAKSNTKTTLVMLVNDGNLIVSDDRRYFTVTFDEPIISIAIDYKYSKVAILLENMHLMVSDQSLSSIQYETDIVVDGECDFIMMEWVGDSIPAIALNGAIVLALPADDIDTSPIYFVDGMPYIFSDVDSIFVLTKECSYRLESIPASIAYLINNNADSDAAKLSRIFDARLTEPFIDAINAINIDLAVSECITAAQFVRNEDSQMFFTAVACFGSAHTEPEKRPAIGELTRSLRVRNALKRANMPITAPQYRALGLGDLLARLSRRHQHRLAIAIARFMGHPIHLIARDLALSVIATTDDDDICLGELPRDIGAGTAAEAALDSGRPQLALALARLEKNPGARSLLLARMERWSEALLGAAETCDTSSLLGVVCAALDSYDVAGADAAIAGCVPAVRLLMKVPNAIDPERLQTIINLVQGPEATELATTFNIFQKTSDAQIESLSSLRKLGAAVDEVVKKTGNRDFEDLPLNRVLEELCLRGEKQLMKMVASKCSVDARRLNSLRMSVYVRNKKFQALKQFAAKKKRREMWPTVVCLLAEESEGLAEEFIEEVGQIDAKAKMALQQDLSEGRLMPADILSRKSYCACFNS